MTCKTESGPIKTGVLACVAAIAMSTSMAALADGHESEKPEGDAVAAGMDLALANQLAAYGDRNSDALALIVAANIMNGLGTIEEREGEAESEGSGEAGEMKPEDDGLLDRARELAGDNEELIALIEDAEMAGEGGCGCTDAGGVAGIEETVHFGGEIEEGADGASRIEVVIHGGAEGGPALVVADRVDAVDLTTVRIDCNPLQPAERRCIANHWTRGGDEDGLAVAQALAVDRRYGAAYRGVDEIVGRTRVEWICVGNQCGPDSTHIKTTERNGRTCAPKQHIGEQAAGQQIGRVIV